MLVGWAGMSFATWGFAIALGVYAFDIGGATAVGVVALVRLLPGVFATPFAGLLGDRHSRRSVILVSALASAIVLGAAALAASSGAPAAAIYALAGLFTVVSSPYVPAEGALLPLVARTPQELAGANVAHSAMDNLGFLAGSALTGVLLATGGPDAAFGLAAAAAALSAAALWGLGRDVRPAYARGETASGLLGETIRGTRPLIEHPGLRLAGITIALLSLFEGAADVMIVVTALELLDLGAGSVGYLNAAWGAGAIASGVLLAVLLDRGRLAAALAGGCLLVGAATALPAAWVAAVAAYLAWVGVGVGYTLSEVAARTLLQRLGSDEILGRIIGTLETARLAAMALGSVAAPALVALLGVRGALLALAALLPAFAVLRWAPMRRLEISAPVPGRPYALLRADPIFEPLPVAIVERLSLDLTPAEVDAGSEILTEGERGERFYLIERGEVEVLRRESGAAPRPMESRSARSPCCAMSRARQRCARPARPVSCRWVATSSSAP